MIRFVKGTGPINSSRRSMLKRTITGLLAGIAAPAFSRLSLAHAASTRLQGKNVLVVYFSRTGNTHVMAGYIREMVGGDIVRIHTVDPYPEEYPATASQAKKELESGYKPPLTTKIENMASYDVVFLGSPRWWGTIATPVISFLSEYPLPGKTVVPFMTHGGSGLGRTMADVGSLCPDATIEQGLAIRGDAIRSSREEVFDWLQTLGMA
ncbi:flavodoxin [Oceanidesulfovibrio marinus]|uniref:Flavodoxin n=2 Tax=Oceanidesulfovibrio marinus TaxID=370038 RepID=A0A6P1ZCY2_9BACT|nr:flavodoxin [Oceanidesulfovibrio marinus]